MRLSSRARRPATAVADDEMTPSPRPSLLPGTDALSDPAFAALVLDASRAKPTSPRRSARMWIRMRSIAPASRCAAHRQVLAATQLQRLYATLQTTGSLQPRCGQRRTARLAQCRPRPARRGRSRRRRALASAQFDDAGNMTDRLAALGVLIALPGDVRERAIAASRTRIATSRSCSTNGSRCRRPSRRTARSSGSKR